MKNLILVLFLVGCAGNVEATEPEQAPEPGECSVTVTELKGNVNGCWKVVGKQLRADYVCDANPSCTLVEGNDMNYASAGPIVVTDVACSQLCPLPWVAQ